MLVRKIIDNIIVSFFRRFGHLILTPFLAIGKIRKNIYCLYIRSLTATPNSCFYVLGRIKMVHPEHIYIGEGTTFGSDIMMEVINEERGTCYMPKIKIGEGCLIGDMSHISAINGVLIGNGALFGRRVLVTDNDHCVPIDRITCPGKRGICSKGKVVIDDNVWICDNVCILSGVHVGKGAIIAANAVVTKDIPPYSLAGGVPAKVIKIYKV